MKRHPLSFPIIASITILLIGAAGVYTYSYSSDLRHILEPFVDTAREILPDILPFTDPCTSPIHYSVGAFDARFGITESQFKKDIAKAAGVWNAALGKTLFIYDPDAPRALKINLVYDYREETTQKLQSIGLVISDTKASYEELKSTYISFLAQYNKDKASIQARIEAYNQEMDAYNAEVNKWNERGGAPRSEYEKLQEMKRQMTAKAAALDRERTTLNERVDTLNAIVGELNHIAKTLNLNVETYNTVGASAGEQFDGGEYVRDASGKRITIYQFDNENKLIRVLEHELGHALGLDHVTDPNAIMYYVNSGTNETLTASDIAELKRICKIQ